MQQAHIITHTEYTQNVVPVLLVTEAHVRKITAKGCTGLPHAFPLYDPWDTLA